MVDVGTVVELGQHAQKAKAADGAPADEFDETVAGIGIGRDEHGAAGVFAVVEGEEEAAAIVPVLLLVAAQGEGAASQLRDPYQDAEKVAERAQGLEVAVG